MPTYDFDDLSRQVSDNVFGSLTRGSVLISSENRFACIVAKISYWKVSFQADRKPTGLIRDIICWCSTKATRTR